MKKNKNIVCAAALAALLLLAFFLPRGAPAGEKNQFENSPVLITFEAVYCGYTFSFSEDFSEACLWTGLCGEQGIPYVLDAENFNIEKDKFLKSLSEEDLKILEGCENKFPYLEPGQIRFNLSGQQIAELKKLLADLKKCKPLKSLFNSSRYDSWKLYIKFKSDKFFYRYSLSMKGNRPRNAPEAAGALIDWLNKNSPKELTLDTALFVHKGWK